MAQRVAGFGTTIFSEINALAAEHNAINLGQGKPDFDGPPEVIQAAIDALSDGIHNQYAPGTGINELRTVIAEHDRQFYDLDIDPQREVLITVGATEAICAAILGLTDPGDEVIVFEPFYDSYIPNILMAGGIPRYCPLRPPTWDFDPDELRGLFNDKTRAIIINTPHNPTGKVFTSEELKLIAELCLAHNVTAITDEVYEHIIFDGLKHESLLQLPDMFERTVRISSIGKSFNVTGWKIGWVVGPSELVTGVQRARQFMTFAVAHPLQFGAACALQMPSRYYDELQAMYQTKRDKMVQMLNNAGLKAATPKGSYFVMADFSDVFDGNDVGFAKWLTSEVGVACIPPTFFYSQPNKHIVSKQARFAFCKSDAVLDAAAEKLAQLGS
jgi:N-succinyldiaminopimelate aminotransferase